MEKVNKVKEKDEITDYLKGLDVEEKRLKTCLKIIN